MNTNQKIFLTINIVGGLLVLVSYFLGLKGGNAADALWGGTPVNIRTIYTISMLISAVGFFFFSAYIFSNLGSGTFASINVIGEKIFLILFILILGASALWIPLTSYMVSNPSQIVWIGVRVVLAIVGLASFGILILLLTLNPRPANNLYFAAVLGIFLFSIHTGVLDAILWPYLWSK